MYAWTRHILSLQKRLMRRKSPLPLGDKVPEPLLNDLGSNDSQAEWISMSEDDVTKLE